MMRFATPRTEMRTYHLRAICFMYRRHVEPTSQTTADILSPLTKTTIRSSPRLPVPARRRGPRVWQSPALLFGRGHLAEHHPRPLRADRRAAAAINALREAHAEQIALVHLGTARAGWFLPRRHPVLSLRLSPTSNSAYDLAWDETRPPDPRAHFRSVFRREHRRRGPALSRGNSPLLRLPGEDHSALSGPGNTVILKVFRITPLIIGLLAEPAGRVRAAPRARQRAAVLADLDTSEHLVSHPTSTRSRSHGFDRPGRRIASISGQHLKRVTWSFGGKSAAFVLPAPTWRSSPTPVPSLAMLNNGRRHASRRPASRPASRYDESSDAFKRSSNSLKIVALSNPETSSPDESAATSKSGCSTTRDQGIKEGALLVTRRPHCWPAGLEQGYYESPETSSSDVYKRDADPPHVRNIFGAAPSRRHRYEDDDDAVRIANDSSIRPLRRRVPPTRQHAWPSPASPPSRTSPSTTAALRRLRRTVLRLQGQRLGLRIRLRPV